MCIRDSCDTPGREGDPPSPTWWLTFGWEAPPKWAIFPPDPLPNFHHATFILQYICTYRKMSKKKNTYTTITSLTFTSKKYLNINALFGKQYGSHKSSATFLRQMLHLLLWEPYCIPNSAFMFKYFFEVKVKELILVLVFFFLLILRYVQIYCKMNVAWWKFGSGSGGKMAHFGGASQPNVNHHVGLGGSPSLPDQRFYPYFFVI